MTDINIGAITEALNDKTDRDMRNVDNTAGGDAVIAYQVPTSGNGYTWYRKYKSGWVEQGGVSSENQTVTLPITMADDTYHIQLTGICNTANNNVTIWGWRNRTTTSFMTQGNIVNQNSQTGGNNTGTKTWMVCGMAA